MNDIALKQAAHIEKREHTVRELRSRIAKTRIMESLLHCSAEIDAGALRYFSAHGVHLQASEYQIVLFSVLSPQVNSGRMYDRMGQYTLIQEATSEALEGFCGFYATEVDGRFAVLLLDPDCVTEGGQELDETCRKISVQCKKLYDITVVVYISEPIRSLCGISPLYNKLRENATLHHFTEYAAKDTVIRGHLPKLHRAAKRLPALQSYARALAGALASNGDYHEEAERVLSHLAYERANSIDDLLRLFGDYFELSCQKFAQLGIPVDTESLRQEQFAMYEESIRWRQITDWFHHTLETIHEKYTQKIQENTMQPFQAAIDYIGIHLSDPTLTVENCARAAGCSSATLQKMFRSRLDMSISSYIRKQRLAKAKALLLSGSMVKDVCKDAGFASIETFHRVFKAEYGITPGQANRFGIVNNVAEETVLRSSPEMAK